MINTNAGAMVATRYRHFWWLLIGILMMPIAVTASEPGAREAQGKEIAFDRRRGNCLACHAIDDGSLPGNLGPALVVMKARFPERESLRSKIWDASEANSQTVMPLFGKHRILTNSEIELVMDYLYSL